MLPGVPPLPNDRDIVLVSEPSREVIEVRNDDERVLFIMEPVTVPDGGGGGGGGGAVASVNGHTGVVVLTKADIALALVDNTADTAKPVSTAMAAALDLKAALVHTHAQYAIAVNLAAIAFSGQSADLTGTIPTALLPPLAITDVFTVASQAAMLALTAQRGDVAVRTDVPKAFILSSESPTTLADWKEIPATGTVVSVNGQTGTVVLTKASVGLGAVDNTSDASKPLSTATVTALTSKADTVHAHVIGDVTGLQPALDGKAASVHAHVIGDVTDLSGALAGKAAVVHGHEITDVTGLQPALDGKIAASLVDVKGDLLAATGADAVARLAVGANGRVLTADSSQASGLAWSVPASGGEQEAYGPVGSGLDEWTCDPVICSTHYPTNNGVLFLVRHRFRKAMSIDEVGFVLQQAGGSPGAYSGVAVYEDGVGVVNRLAQSADQGAAFTTIGVKSLALTAGAAVAAGEFRWIGYLWQGGSVPRLFAPPGPPDESIMNVGRRRTVFQTGQTGFPSTMNVAAMSMNTTTYWFSFKDV